MIQNAVLTSSVNESLNLLEGLAQTLINQGTVLPPHIPYPLHILVHETHVSMALQLLTLQKSSGNFLQADINKLLQSVAGCV